MLRASLARSPAPRVLLAGIVAALAVIAALAPGPVVAHAELLESTPAAGGSILEAPDRLELRFSEPIDPDLAFVDVLDASREPVDGVGELSVEEGGRTAHVPLPDLAPAVYTVTYQVVSTVDGHATAGAFAFVVDPTGAEAPPAVPIDSSTPAVDAWAVAARWVALAGGLLALGGLVAWWRSRHLVIDGAPPWGLIGLGAVLAYAGLAAYLWLSARPIVAAVPERGGGLPLDFAAPFGATPFAMAMRVGLVASLVTIGLAAVGARSPRARSWVAGVATGAAALTLAGMSMAAHAAAAGGVGFGLLDWAHLVGAAAWLGALPALVLLGRRPGPGVAALLRRHGAVALVAAPVVLLTGIANSPLVLGEARSLVASQYGNLLLAKAGLLSVALAIGAVNHLALRGHGRGRVLALVGTEIAVAVAAVAVAATMVTIQPAAARQPAVVSAPIAPAHLFGRTGPADVHATIELPIPGSQRYLVTVIDAGTGGPRDDVQLVLLEMTPPAGSELPTERLRLEPNPLRAGLYGGEGAYLGVEGDWQVDVIVRRRGELDERVSFTVPVQQPTPPQLVPPTDTGVGVPAPIALLWGILPAGPAAWLPAGAALALLALVAVARPSGRATDVVVILIAVVACVGVLGAGTRTVVAVANAPPPDELAEHAPPPGFVPSRSTGEAVYRANCAACHGTDGDGDGPVQTLPPAGGLAEAVERMSAAELSYRIANGLAGTPMPAFAATLTEAERWHLVNYLEERWNEP